ncbi:hypothetical protein VTK56DRAFT_4253 [Thermocarpiscus australiensis]
MAACSREASESHKFSVPGYLSSGTVPFSADATDVRAVTSDQTSCTTEADDAASFLLWNRSFVSRRYMRNKDDQPIATDVLDLELKCLGQNEQAPSQVSSSSIFDWSPFKTGRSQALSGCPSDVGGLEKTPRDGRTLTSCSTQKCGAACVRR